METGETAEFAAGREEVEAAVAAEATRIGEKGIDKAAIESGVLGVHVARRMPKPELRRHRIADMPRPIVEEAAELPTACSRARSAKRSTRNRPNMPTPRVAHARDPRAGVIFGCEYVLLPITHGQGGWRSPVPSRRSPRTGRQPQDGKWRIASRSSRATTGHHRSGNTSRQRSAPPWGPPTPLAGHAAPPPLRPHTRRAR